MKIEVLRIKDFKKIKELEIRPKDNIIVIAGENASGKTSALDAILWALGGEKLKKRKIVKPVRKGQKKAEVFIELDNYIVEKYCENNRVSHLTLTDKNKNIKPKSPQTILDGFVGELSFDPREFMMASPKGQRDLLLKTFGLKEKLEEINSKKEQIYNTRAIVNKDIKAYEGQLEGMEQPRKDLPKNIISLIDLTKKLEKAKDWNDRLKVDIEEAKMIMDEIDEHKFEIKKLEKEAKEMGNRIVGKNPKDLEKFRLEIEKAESLNEEIRSADKYIQIENGMVDKKTKSEAMTKFMTKLDEKKVKILKEKKIPFKIEEEGISFKNIPFNQLADSEKLKFSVRMAMVMNPKLKVIRITDANLLDNKNMEIITKMADKFDYQIWLERISVDKFTDIVLVDGEVKNG